MVDNAITVSCNVQFIELVVNIAQSHIVNILFNVFIHLLFCHFTAPIVGLTAAQLIVVV